MSLKQPRVSAWVVLIRVMDRQTIKINLEILVWVTLKGLVATLVKAE